MFSWQPKSNYLLPWRLSRKMLDMICWNKNKSCMLARGNFFTSIGGKSCSPLRLETNSQALVLPLEKLRFWMNILIYFSHSEKEHKFENFFSKELFSFWNCGGGGCRLWKFNILAWGIYETPHNLSVESKPKLQTRGVTIEPLHTPPLLKTQAHLMSLISICSYFMPSLSS